MMDSSYLILIHLAYLKSKKLREQRENKKSREKEEIYNDFPFHDIYDCSYNSIFKISNDTSHNAIKSNNTSYSSCLSDATTVIS